MAWHLIRLFTDPSHTGSRALGSRHRRAVADAGAGRFVPYHAFRGGLRSDGVDTRGRRSLEDNQTSDVWWRRADGPAGAPVESSDPGSPMNNSSSARRCRFRFREITISAVRASGPGGQKVNKTSAAIDLHFDIGASSLPEAIRTRLRARADRRISEDGVLRIKAQEHRTQTSNRRAALERLAEMIRAAAVVSAAPAAHRTPRVLRASAASTTKAAADARKCFAVSPGRTPRE